MNTKIKSSRSEKEIELDNLFGNKASRIIKSKMAFVDMNTEGLADLLTKSGRPSTPQAIRNKLREGNFKAYWYLHVLYLLENLENSKYDI